METQTFESACGFVRRGFGVGLIDAITARRYQGQLDLFPFAPSVWQTVYVLRPLDRPASRLTIEFCGVFEDRMNAYRPENFRALGSM